MKYCPHCGKELIDEAVVCIACGCSVPKTKRLISEEKIPEKDEADSGLVILSALFPIVGLILWALKNNDMPKAAKSYGMAALIACGAYVVIYLLVVVIISAAVGGFLGSI